MKISDRNITDFIIDGISVLFKLVSVGRCEISASELVCQRSADAFNQVYFLPDGFAVGVSGIKKQSEVFAQPLSSRYFCKRAEAPFNKAYICR